MNSTLPSPVSRNSKLRSDASFSVNSNRISSVASIPIPDKSPVEKCTRLRAPLPPLPDDIPPLRLGISKKASSTPDRSRSNPMPPRGLRPFMRFAIRSASASGTPFSINDSIASFNSWSSSFLAAFFFFFLSQSRFNPMLSPFHSSSNRRSILSATSSNTPSPKSGRTIFAGAGALFSSRADSLFSSCADALLKLHNAKHRQDINSNALLASDIIDPL